MHCLCVGSCIAIKSAGTIWDIEDIASIQGLFPHAIMGQDGHYIEQPASNAASATNTVLASDPPPLASGTNAVSASDPPLLARTDLFNCNQGSCQASGAQTSHNYEIYMKHFSIDCSDTSLRPTINACLS
jgi:hypothetical protein